MVSLHRSYDTLCYPLCSGGTIPSLPLIMSVDKSLPVLHNAHVWAYFRHHPLDPDASLFVAFDEGSVRAYREIHQLPVG